MDLGPDSSLALLPYQSQLIETHTWLRGLTVKTNKIILRLSNE